jgi:hypothetical protein
LGGLGFDDTRNTYQENKRKNDSRDALASHQ